MIACGPLLAPTGAEPEKQRSSDAAPAKALVKRRRLYGGEHTQRDIK